MSAKLVAMLGLAALSAGSFSPMIQRANAQSAAVKAQETKGTPDERADRLAAQMTEEEKISLLSGGGFTTHAVERLGIPEFTMSDGPQGVRNGPGTPAPRACAFPAGVALAATWDVDLAAAYGKAIGLEGRARGTNFQLGPGVNISRLPVNGRNFEYFGEDPFLAAQVAVHWVKAASAQGVVPTIKHFAANNQETDRNSVNVQADERTLLEIYLPAFRKAATEGGIVAIMCSYNRLNGDYASNNDWLLNQTLKQSWGFKGLVMSDWGASHNVTDLAKGLDLEMPNGRNLSLANVKAALTSGTLTTAEIDGAVHRLLRTAAAQGWLDAGWQQKKSDLPLDSEDSAKTALEVAESSIVLLKNAREALPLDRAKVKTIVVLGPNASATSGTMPINIGGGGSGAVTPFATRFADADYLTGISKAAGGAVKVVYLPMPGTASDADYATFANARVPVIDNTNDNGQRGVRPEPGLYLDIDVAGSTTTTKLAHQIQKGIDLTWTAGQLPLGVPAGRDATFSWSGGLFAQEDGDYLLHANGPAGGPAITIGGKPYSDGDTVHLQKWNELAIKVEQHLQASPSAGRRGQGRRGGGRRGGPANANSLRVALVSLAIPEADMVKTADAAIVCVGLNRNVESEGRDRPFDLPSLQQYLIKQTAAANPRTIVINNSGAGVGIAAWESNVAAIVQAWYLGQEGGIAIGKALFGDVNPSGKLCATFDRAFEENPAFAYYPGTTAEGAPYRVEPYTEGIFYGYRGYDKAGKAPLYPFGFGLSYTTFEMSNLKVEKDGEGLKVSLDIKNSGSRAGAEVAQIYVGEQGCPVPRPVRELKGFAKPMLQPGESKRIEIELPKESFAYWSPEKKDWTIDAGKTFTIEAGTSEREIKLKQEVKL